MRAGILVSADAGRRSTRRTFRMRLGLPTPRSAVVAAALLTLVPAARRDDVRRAPVWNDAPAHVLDRVVPNDNRVAAGTLRHGVLSLRVVARVADWHPDGDDAPGAPMMAFAEEDGPARIPGPLVRVPAGTEAAVRVRNTLDDTLRVYGLFARVRPLGADTVPLVLAPGESREVRFRLDLPGTYLYWGTTMRRSIALRTHEDAQLSGAIVVDSAGVRSNDRVFVIGAWSDTIDRAGTRRQRVLAVINGRSWPHTERLSHTVGDTVRWRMINASADLHPMHLHGFYFRVTSRGDGSVDTPASDLAVTEPLLSAGSVSLEWVPERAGNWLVHCHVPEHFAPRGPLGTRLPAGAATHDHARGGMNGLVLGVTVRPKPGVTARASSAERARRIRLLVRENAGSTAATPFFGYALHEAGAEPARDSGLTPAPVLDLVRGEPVRITVVNRLREPTAVHWHGIELESYFDGVPGFSGAGARVTPLIAPNDSFEVRLTPPRAGTFIYHTHADETRQQHAGLAGALVVRDPGTTRDPAIDIPLVLTSPTAFEDNRRGSLVNASATPAPITMTVGRTYRLRLIQMSAHRAASTVELKRGDSLFVWRPVAKDGADLPSPVRVLEPARAFVTIGETGDFEVTPTELGDLRLEVRYGGPLGSSPGGIERRALVAGREVIAATLPIRVTMPDSPPRRSP